MVTDGSVTDVTIELVTPRDATDRLRAYATALLCGVWVVKDLRVIQGERGLFVSMPSKRAREECPFCRRKNDFQAWFCSYCGKRLPDWKDKLNPDEWQGPRDLHYDIFHPVSQAGREPIQRAVLRAYHLALADSLREQKSADNVDEFRDLEEVG